MADRVESAQKATEIAIAYLRPYYSFVRPVKADRQDGNWIVEVDVGPFLPRITRFRIDPETGNILSYEAAQ